MYFATPSKHFHAAMYKFSDLSSFASKLFIVENKNLKERLIKATKILTDEKSFLIFFFCF